MNSLVGFFKVGVVFLTIQCLFNGAFLQAQLVITEATNTAEEEAAVNTLVGSGVTVSNLNIECGDSPTGTGFGSFDGSAVNWQLSSGIIMSSGAVVDAAGPNLAGTVTSDIVGGPLTDTELNSLATLDLNDICRVTLDVVPLGDTLQFFYVFGSEEYYGFTCSSFNDVFGFFISGPNPDGGMYESVNIAIVPETDPPLPVAISTVNNGSGNPGGPCEVPASAPNGGEDCPCNSLYYIDNDFPPGADVQYRGFTRPLTAFAKVIPCETYTLKLAIADAGDSSLDSGVFIESGSLSSKNVGVSSATGYNPDGTGDIAIEDCVDAVINFEFPFDVYDDAVVYFSFDACEAGAEAINGVDFDMLSDSLEIPEGTTADSIVIAPNGDNLLEGLECVEVNVDSIRIGSCTFPLGSQTEVVIFDEIQPIVFDQVPAGPHCPGWSTQLSATGGFSYAWTPANLVNDPTSPTPMATVTETTLFNCAITVGPCTENLEVLVEVVDNPLPPDPTPVVICREDPIMLDVAIPEGFAYNWQPMDASQCQNCLDNAFVANPTFTPNGEDVGYNVLITFTPGCTDTLRYNLIYDEVTFLNGPTDLILCADNDMEVSIPGGEAGTYTWTPTTGLSCTDCPNPTINLSSSETYTITAMNAQNCEDEWQLAVDVRGVSADAGDDVFQCLDYTGQLGSPGNAANQYSWSPATSLDDPTIAQPTFSYSVVNGVGQSIDYSLTITSPDGCQSTDEVSVSVQAEAIIEVTAEQNIYVGSTAVLSASGAGADGSYVWEGPNLLNSTGETVTAQPADTAMYMVTGTNMDGCIGTASTTVNVEVPPFLLFPEAFSPTGHNKIFNWLSRDITEIISWQIFNRYGELVYDGSFNNFEGWDGTHKGALQPMGVYLWQIRYIDESKGIEPVIDHGNVTLIR